MKGIRKAGRLQKRWIDAGEKNLKTVGIRNWPAVARDQKQWRTVKPRSTSDCSASGQGGGRGE